MAKITIDFDDAGIDGGGDNANKLKDKKPQSDLQKQVLQNIFGDTLMPFIGLEKLADINKKFDEKDSGDGGSKQKTKPTNTDDVVGHDGANEADDLAAQLAAAGEFDTFSDFVAANSTPSGKAALATIMGLAIPSIGVRYGIQTAITGKSPLSVGDSDYGLGNTDWGLGFDVDPNTGATTDPTTGLDIDWSDLGYEHGGDIGGNNDTDVSGDYDDGTGGYGGLF